MFMPSRLVTASASLLVLSSAALAEGAGLGRAATPDEIASWDVSIGPNGAGLPPGSGTPQQGEQVYVAKCLGCHGEKGAGKYGAELGGGMRVGTTVDDLEALRASVDELVDASQALWSVNRRGKIVSTSIRISRRPRTGRAVPPPRHLP